MALVLSKTYDALLAAGAPEDKARDASEEIASYENRLTRIEAELDEIRRTMATKTLGARADFRAARRRSGAASSIALSGGNRLSL